MKRVFLLVAFVVACFTSNSWSHLNSMSFSTIKIGEETIEFQMEFTLLCTLELFAVDSDNDNFLSKDELHSAWSMMYYYLSNKMKVLADGRQLRMTLRDIQFDVREEDSYTVYKVTYDKPKDAKQVIILCNVQEETDPYHRNIAEITLPNGDQYMYVFTNLNYFDSANISRHARKIEPKDKGEEENRPEQTAADEPGSATKEE